MITLDGLQRTSTDSKKGLQKEKEEDSKVSLEDFVILRMTLSQLWIFKSNVYYYRYSAT